MKKLKSVERKTFRKRVGGGGEGVESRKSCER